MRATVTRVLMGTILLGALVTPALAQDVPPLELRPSIEAAPLSPEEAAALAQALSFDPATIAAPAGKALRLPSLQNSHSLDISHSDKSDGSSTMVLKQPLANDSAWDAKVGADLGLKSQANDGYRQGRPLPVVRDTGDTGAAWASLGVKNFASVDARVDPTNDQGKLGTTFKQSIPLGKNYSVTLQDSYSVTETLSAQPSAPGDLPMMALPTTPGAAATAPQVWGNERLAKFDVLSTGTTLAAGLNSTSTDPVTHNKFSAEQKLYGPLHVTTSVSDLGQPVPNKSVTAGFKLNW